MKRKTIFSTIFTVILFSTLAITLWLALPSELPPATTTENVCEQYGVRFNMDSVAAIYQDPGGILADPALFWEEDLTYRLVASAPMHWGKSLPPDGWVENIERVSALSSQQRENAEPYARALEVIEHADTFCQNAMPVIYSLIPPNADQGTTVYLAAFNEPVAFAYRSNVVMNTELGDTSKFFNILGHEIFHIGYFDAQPFQTEVWSNHYPTKVILTTLQNDGLAVYTQYLLHKSAYPTPMELELIFLNNKLILKMLIGRLNAVLENSGSYTEDNVYQEAVTGTNQRALYVIGAYMARSIDEALGRDALVETVRQGPQSFIATYNTVADQGWEVYEIPASEGLTELQVLRQAALQGSWEAVEDAVRDIQSSGIENPTGAAFESLVSTGLILLRDDQANLAVAVFELLAATFPDHPLSYYYLGEAYTHTGDTGFAAAAYQKALELDPSLALVIE